MSNCKKSHTSLCKKGHLVVSGTEDLHLNFKGQKSITAPHLSVVQFRIQSSTSSTIGPTKGLMSSKLRQINNV